MGHADLFINGVLSSLLLISTPSPSLRPIEGLYDQEAQTLNPRSDDGESGRLLASRERIFTEHTDDAGAKLSPRYYVALAGTGDEDIVILPPVTHWRLSQQTDAIHAPAESVASPLPAHAEAVRWIQHTTGLSEGRVAELLGVERLTVRNWKAGRPIKDVSMRRLLETKDVLRRAQRWYRRPDEMVTWLHTPDLDNGISPARLLSEGNFDRARFLAVLAPSTVEPTPTWARRPVPAAWQEALERPHHPGEFVEDSSKRAKAEYGATRR